MRLYMSGTPRNDAYQPVENRLCTHRLFSMHGAYERAVLTWLKHVKRGIDTSEKFFAAFPDHKNLALKRDLARREKQKKLEGIDHPFVKLACESDWDTEEVMQAVCDKTQSESPYPKHILLDSGAFTAWNMGEKTSVDDVCKKYAAFIEQAGDLFDEIWMINLDVIPGERGRDPTQQELIDAVKESDVNFGILTKEFGNNVMPVFHQGEDLSRLNECIDQVADGSRYICVSPRNDVAETLRVKWSADCHREINAQHSNVRTHGLATTGNNMIRTVPWYSGDSAAWVQHGGFGMVDIFHGAEQSYGKKSEPHYMNYFMSVDNIMEDGAASSDTREIRGGKLGIEGKHIYSCSDGTKAHVVKQIEEIGFPFASAIWDSRIRNLICMASFQAFSQWASNSVKPKTQATLLGEL